MVLTSLPPAHINKNETLQLKTDRKLKTANEKGRVPHSKSKRSTSYKNSTSYKQIEAHKTGMMCFKCESCPDRALKQQLHESPIPSEANVPFISKGSSFPTHLAHTFSKSHWTTLCSNLSNSV